MKRRKISFALAAAVLVCCLLPTTAFAWDETDMTAFVSFTKEAPDQPTYTPKYEIGIPAPAQIVNSSAEIKFRLIYNDMSDDELLTVRLDPSVFSDDEYFHMTSPDTPDVLKSVIHRMGTDRSQQIHPVDGPFIVAVFDNSGLEPVEYGTIQIASSNDHLVSPGEYTGYLRFTIELTKK